MSAGGDRGRLSPRFIPDLPMRLDKFLATCTELSRADAKKALHGGRVKIDHADNFDSAAELHDLIRKKRPEARVDLGTCRALCSFYAEAGGLMIGVEI